MNTYEFCGKFNLKGEPRKDIFYCSNEEIVRDYTVPEIEYYCDLYGTSEFDDALKMAREARDKYWSQN